jgi:hypothetical protein
MRKPSLLDPNFRYVPARETNVAETFRRIREELAREAEAKEFNRLRPANTDERASGSHEMKDRLRGI